MKRGLSLLIVAVMLMLPSCTSANSSTLEDVLNELNPVSFASDVPTEPLESVGDTLKLSFIGDCLVSTYKGDASKGTLNWYAQNYQPSYFFEKVYDTLSADDYTIANCETVLTDRKLPERAKGGSRVFWFYGPTTNAKIFTAGSVEVTGVVNNHMYDYKQPGYDDTVAALKKENLIVGDYDKPVYLTKNGIKAAVLFVDLWSYGDTTAIIKAMKALDADTDYKIIYFHGGIEGTNYPEQWKVDACRALIDAGANFVIGAHPHVLQPIEKYNGGVIVYSLGNFLFGGNTAPVKNTIIYQIELKKGDYQQNVIPCQVYSGSRNNWQPCYPETEANRQKTLDLLVMTDRRYTPKPSSSEVSSEASSGVASEVSSRVSSGGSSGASSSVTSQPSSTVSSGSPPNTSSNVSAQSNDLSSTGSSVDTSSY